MSLCVLLLTQELLNAYNAEGQDECLIVPETILIALKYFCAIKLLIGNLLLKGFLFLEAHNTNP